MCCMPGSYVLHTKNKPPIGIFLFASQATNFKKPNVCYCLILVDKYDFLEYFGIIFWFVIE